jgi:hypothetical protein
LIVFLIVKLTLTQVVPDLDEILGHEQGAMNLGQSWKRLTHNGHVDEIVFDDETMSAIHRFFIDYY